MVNNNDIDEAMLLLNGIMQREGMTKRWRLTRTYEKPTWVGLCPEKLGVHEYFFLLRPETESTTRSAEPFMMRI